MKKTITAAVLAIVASGAMAQVSNFQGFSGAVNLNTVSTTNKLSLDGTTIDGLGQQSQSGSIQAAYGFTVSPTAVISVGASYGLGKNKAGSIGLDDGTLSITTKNQMSLYVEPGLMLSEKTLAYGKISYERAKGVASFTGEESESRNVTGTGFGFGIRTMVSKTSFIQAEVRQVAYKNLALDDAFSLKAKAVVGSIGFGIKF